MQAFFLLGSISAFQVSYSKLLRRSPEVHSSVPWCSATACGEGQDASAAAPVLLRQVQDWGKIFPGKMPLTDITTFTPRPKLYSCLCQHQGVQVEHSFLHPSQQNAQPRNTIFLLDGRREGTNQSWHLLGTLTVYHWKIHSCLIDEQYNTQSHSNWL